MDANSSPVAPVGPFHEKSSPEPDARERQLAPARQTLLSARIKDLRLHLAGTPLERAIHQLYRELDAHGISFRPQCYLSDQWGCPSGVPVIGLPFYLADPDLHAIEDELGGGVESEGEILKYLRHEAGHALNYAYRLYDTPEWRKVFGDYGKPYREDYKPQPFSRRYVRHIAGYYAQKHPDEDFAETFAVWLTPGSEWERRYAGWGALKKLQYVDQVVKQIGHTPPRVTLAEKDLDVDEMEETVLDHYERRKLEEKVELRLREDLDEDLHEAFEPPGKAPAKAEILIRMERAQLLNVVSNVTGVARPVVRALLEHLIARASALGLTVHLDKQREYLTRLTALVTALAMKYLYTDRFVED